MPPPRDERHALLRSDRHGILSPTTASAGWFEPHAARDLAEVMPYLNQSLADLGYPHPLELGVPNAGDLARTCNVLFLLLRDRQNDVAAREHALDERRRLQSELARVEMHHERARAERDAKEKELAAASNRHATMAEALRRKVDESTAERDALRTQLAQAAQKRVHLENEARKREKEHEKLKAKLSTLVNDRRREVVCASIVVGKPAPSGGVKARVGSGRSGVSVTSTSRHRSVAAAAATSKAAALGVAARVAADASVRHVSQDLHASMMAAYEAKLRALMHDAADLRECLRANGVDPDTGTPFDDGEDAGGHDTRTRRGVGEGRPAGAKGAAAVRDEGVGPAPARRQPPRVGGSPLGSPRASRYARNATGGGGNEEVEDAFSFNLAALRRRLVGEVEPAGGAERAARGGGGGGTGKQSEGGPVGDGGAGRKGHGSTPEPRQSPGLAPFAPDSRKSPKKSPKKHMHSPAHFTQAAAPATTPRQQRDATSVVATSAWGASRLDMLRDESPPHRSPPRSPQQPTPPEASSGAGFASPVEVADPERSASRADRSASPVPSRLQLERSDPGRLAAADASPPSPRLEWNAAPVYEMTPTPEPAPRRVSEENEEVRTEKGHEEGVDDEREDEAWSRAPAGDGEADEAWERANMPTPPATTAATQRRSSGGSHRSSDTSAPKALPSFMNTNTMFSPLATDGEDNQAAFGAAMRAIRVEDRPMATLAEAVAAKRAAEDASGLAAASKDRGRVAADEVGSRGGYASEEMLEVELGSPLNSVGTSPSAAAGDLHRGRSRHHRESPLKGGTRLDDTLEQETEEDEPGDAEDDGGAWKARRGDEMEEKETDEASAERKVSFDRESSVGGPELEVMGDDIVGGGGSSDAGGSPGIALMPPLSPLPVPGRPTSVGSHDPGSAPPMDRSRAFGGARGGHATPQESAASTGHHHTPSPAVASKPTSNRGSQPTELPSTPASVHTQGSVFAPGAAPAAQSAAPRAKPGGPVQSATPSSPFGFSVGEDSVPVHESPLDALLARHLSRGRESLSPAGSKAGREADGGGGGERRPSIGSGRHRRRENPFAAYVNKGGQFGQSPGD